jgi:hypothetical protein
VATGDFEILTSPVHTAEEIKALNDSMRAIGLKRIADREAAKAAAQDAPEDDEL